MKNIIRCLVGFVFFSGMLWASDITVLTPRAGETWQRGTTHNITWDWHVDSGLPAPTKVEIYLYQRGVWVRDIARGAANTMTYPWTIPNDCPLGASQIFVSYVAGSVTISNLSGVFTIAEAAPVDHCGVVYPRPSIGFTGIDTGGRVCIEVINRSSYAAEMFRHAPDLPPCGLNTSASRTWANIYNADTGALLNSFCSMYSGSGLRNIWFLPAAGVTSGRVYVVLRDRACARSYRSATINWSR